MRGLSAGSEHLRCEIETMELAPQTVRHIKEHGTVQRSAAGFLISQELRLL
jgi:hypothetical protein